MRRQAATKGSSSRRSTRCRADRGDVAGDGATQSVRGRRRRSDGRAGRLRPSRERVPQAARGAAGRYDDHPDLERAWARCCRRFVRESCRSASPRCPMTRSAPFSPIRPCRDRLDMGSAARRGRAGCGSRAERPDVSSGARHGRRRSRQARRILDAATAPDRGTRMRVALSQGGFGARGKFSDTLDALTVLLHERSRAAVKRGTRPRPSGAARAVDVVEEAKELASGNVNPQLLTASLCSRSRRPHRHERQALPRRRVRRSAHGGRLGQAETERVARATGCIRMKAETLDGDRQRRRSKRATCSASRELQASWPPKGPPS